ncbi:MAG TPA: DMT family transporter [Candidatus Dependentiae bacterium]|nr:DMT family transporter [Candidatus Dependentiae bacterium]HRQ62475.1 DMT family transporter [Candidatus Dependentiae bacterium]
MFLIILLYALLASTFTLGKAALDYGRPFFLIAVRMFVGGGILLSYQYFADRSKFYLKTKDLFLFSQIFLFHIYLSYMLEFWALEYLSAASVGLIYNISPFVTAIFSYFLFHERLSGKQNLGLIIGFFGLLPIIMQQTPEEIAVGSFYVSLPELALFISVAAACYGWIVMKQLLDRGYTPVMVNGVGMIVGGSMALLTSLWWDGLPVIKPAESEGLIRPFLINILGSHGAGIAIFAWYALLLVVVANIIFYNLYGELLKKYSATFLSFVGFITPLFAALFGWLMRGEEVTWHFFASVIFVTFGLYVFYQDEL